MYIVDLGKLDRVIKHWEKETDKTEKGLGRIAPNAISVSLQEVKSSLIKVDLPEDQTKLIQEQQRQIDLLDRKVNELNFALEMLSKMVALQKKSE